jgi:hypothetical protein
MAPVNKHACYDPMRRLLFAVLPLVTSAPVHAAWLHACPASTAVPAGVQAEARSADLRWFVDEQPSLPGCGSVPLAPGARVESLYPLDPGESPARTILLHGNVAQGRFAVSEHELPAAQPGPAAPSPMPLHTNLLAGMTARVFGAEERARARIENGQLIVDCREGKRTAGVVLTGPWYLPRAKVALAAGIEGNAEGFSWQLADATRAARGDALDMAALPGSGKALRMALPNGLDRAGWRQFVLLCPTRQASLRIASLALEPAQAGNAGDAGKSAPRATWVWRPGDWIENGPALLDWAAAHDIHALFMTVPLKDGMAVRSPDLLAGFVRQAGARGIRVLSVDGDPHMVLENEIPNVVRRVQAYAAYNASVAPEARLAGVQFDVEPYLLPESTLPSARRDERYLAMARALKDAAGGLPLEFVAPFWWGSHRELLDGLAAYADMLTVMDYRTDPGQVYDFAAPFLDWAEAHGKGVRIALEAGAIDPEVQRRYARADAGEAGELQALDVKGRTVLALLRAPVSAPMSAPDARLYRLQSTRDIDGSATTFHRDKAALGPLLPRLEADFGAWEAFRGMAVHELR